jgi:hypothetical protein
MRPAAEGVDQADLWEVFIILGMAVLLDYSREEIARDKQDQQLTRWGGRTKVPPTTGEDCARRDGQSPGDAEGDSLTDVFTRQIIQT